VLRLSAFYALYFAILGVLRPYWPLYLENVGFGPGAIGALMAILPATKIVSPAFWGWLADYPDPENFLFLLYGPNSKAKFDGENSSNYANAEFDQLFDRMKDLDDTPERAAMIGKMIEIMQEDLPMLYGWSEEFGGAYQQWVSNGKPSNIIRDSLPYLRIDTQLRASKIKEWNQGIWWPLAVLPLLLLALAWPAWQAWRRRQSQHAVQGNAHSQRGL
jgi:hypothetical protein